MAAAFGMLITCAFAIHCCLSYAEHIAHVLYIVYQ